MANGGVSKASWMTFLFIASGLLVLFWILLNLKNTPFVMVGFRQDDEFVAILSRLGVLVVLALFVERAVQVYVTTFLEQRQLELKARVAMHAAIDADASKNAPLAATLAEQDQNSQDTKVRATTASLILGTLLGLCGVSVLGALLEDNVVMPIPLRLIDIVIVGTLLAGGADPIHQIMQAITNSLTQMKQRTAPGQ